MSERLCLLPDSNHLRRQGLPDGICVASPAQARRRSTSSWGNGNSRAGSPIQQPNGSRGPFRMTLAVWPHRPPLRSNPGAVHPERHDRLRGSAPEERKPGAGGQQSPAFSSPLNPTWPQSSLKVSFAPSGSPAQGASETRLGAQQRRILRGSCLAATPSIPRSDTDRR